MWLLQGRMAGYGDRWAENFDEIELLSMMEEAAEGYEWLEGVVGNPTS